MLLCPRFGTCGLRGHFLISGAFATFRLTCSRFSSIAGVALSSPRSHSVSRQVGLIAWDDMCLRSRSECTTSRRSNVFDSDHILQRKRIIGFALSPSQTLCTMMPRLKHSRSCDRRQKIFGALTSRLWSAILVGPTKRLTRGCSKRAGAQCTTSLYFMKYVHRKPRPLVLLVAELYLISLLRAVFAKVRQR